MTYYFIIFIAFLILSFYLAVRNTYKFQEKLDSFNLLSNEIRELSEKIERSEKINLNIKSNEPNCATNLSTKLYFPDSYSLCDPNAFIKKEDYKHYIGSIHALSEIINAKKYNIKNTALLKDKYS
jgi:hypothetical protein